MKLKIDWKALGRMIWDAVKPVLLAAIGGGVVSLTGGCSSLQPATKSQSMTVTALGFPAITVVTTTSQSATNDGDDEGENTQTTSADVKPDVDASVVPTSTRASGRSETGANAEKGQSARRKEPVEEP